MRALAALDFPHVVTAHDGNVEGNVAYLAMEFIEGVDLRHLDAKILTISYCCELLRLAALGLAALHDAGMLHRDVKPANLMLTQDGVVKIVDLGLAKFEEEETELTSRRSVLGTVKYMSPEQHEGVYNLDFRSDIFSLGQTLKNLLSRQTEIVPEELQKLVDEMVHPDREQRLLTARDVTTRLQRFIDHDVPSETESHGIRAIADQWRLAIRRYRWMVPMADRP